MRILLTGADGFLGRPLFDELAAGGHELLLVVLDEASVPSEYPRATVFQCDLRDLATLGRHVTAFQPEACAHLAWAGIPDYGLATSLSNLAMSVGFLDTVLRRTECRRFVVSGSCLEYGASRGECVEGEPGRPRSHFTWAKSALHEFCRFRCLEAGRELVWFRVFYAYGPRQRSGALIPSLISCFREGRRPTLTHPQNANDFVHVRDIARAFCMGLTSPAECGVYNIGTGRSVSVLDVCATVEEFLRGGEEATRELRKHAVAEGCSERVDFWASTAKMRGAFRWTPTVSLRQGIEELVAREKDA